MRIRNRQPVAVAGPEARPESKWGSRVTTVLYVLVLFAVVGYLTWYVYDRFRHFEARGFVVSSTTVLGAERDGRLDDLGVRAGDTVRSGAVLATLRPATPCAAPDERDARSARAGARLTRSRIAVLNRQIQDARTRLADLGRNAGLELDGGDRRAERERVEREVRDLEAERRIRLAELRLQEEEVDALAAAPVEDPRCAPHALTAPFDAVVYAVHRQEHEVVRGGDPVMTVQPLDSEVQVLAYVDPDDLSDVAPGQTVTVRFPDGVVTRGRVEALHAAATRFAELELEGYRPVGSDLVAAIEPVDRETALLWRGLDRLEVLVRGDR